jgi:hypothetical protein
VSYIQLVTHPVELPSELAPAIGQHALESPASFGQRHHDHLLQERGGLTGVAHRHDFRQRVRTRRIARRDLPQLPDSLQLADVERVDADKLSRLVGLNVPRPRSRQTAAGSLGQ